MKMDGILLMAYGTPKNLNDVERYYTEILRGSKPSSAQIEKLKKRYAAIGGSSPLLEITRSTASKLQELIGNGKDGPRVYFGMKYSDPHIYDAIKNAIGDSVSRLFCIPVAPFYSSIGTGSYFDKVKKAAEELKYKGELVFVNSWYDEPHLANAWVKKLEDLHIDKSWTMLFTAHSLPLTAEDDLSVYRRQLIYASNSVERHFGCKWSLSFQSAADVPGKWIGPDAAWQIEGLAKNGIKKLVIIPIGFVSDNLETMYDAGIEYLNLCEKLGIEAIMPKMPNDSEDIITALYGAYSKAAKK
ncbi:MAG: ferrochelatase [Methanothrix sp.]